jgi:hypothetical protein
MAFVNGMVFAKKSLQNYTSVNLLKTGART